MQHVRRDPNSPEVIRSALLNILEHWPPKITVTKAQYDALIRAYPDDSQWINHAVDNRILVIKDD